MGMAAGGARSPAKRGRRRATAPMSEINVTPLVDVMLVLLIVFMVAAPLMTMGVPIELPQTRASAMPLKARPVTVTVTPNGAMSIDREPVTLEALVATVKALINDTTDQRIYVRGDSTAQYGMIMQVMSELSAAGYDKIGLITEPAKAP